MKALGGKAWQSTKNRWSLHDLRATLRAPTLKVLAPMNSLASSHHKPHSDLPPREQINLLLGSAHSILEQVCFPPIS